MRLLVALLVVAPVFTASAQEPAYPPADPYSSPPPPLVAPPLPPPMPGQQPMMARATLSRSLVRQWRGARVMNGFAGAIGLLSTGLSLSGAIYVAAAHYPPSVD